MWRRVTPNVIGEEAGTSGILYYAKQLFANLRWVGDETMEVDGTHDKIRIKCSFLGLCRIYNAACDLFIKRGIAYNTCLLRVNTQHPQRRDCEVVIDVTTAHLNRLKLKVEHINEKKDEKNNERKRIKTYERVEDEGF